MKTRTLKKDLTRKIALFVIIMMASVLGAVAVMMTNSLKSQMESSLAVEADHIEEILEKSLSFQKENIISLAQNDFISNSLIDVSGRAQYIPTIMNGFIETRNIAAITLVDFEGKNIHSSMNPPPDYLGQTRLRSSLESGRPVLEFNRQRRRIIFIEPIFFYQTTQGAVVMEIDLNVFVSQAIVPSENLLFRLFQQEKKVFEAQHQTGDYLSARHHFSPSSKYLAQLGLSLEIGTLKSSYFDLVEQVVQRIGHLALIFVLFSVLFAGKVANGIATPILKLCERVKNHDILNNRSIDISSSSVELEELAAAFNERNRRLNKEIEERKEAEARTELAYERFKTVMDGIDAMVYVIDMETYELLFLNKYGQEKWGDITGEICWQKLQGEQEGPCSFCTNDQLLDSDGQPVGVVIWEAQNTLDNRWYQCRDQAIKWTDNRFVRMEIAVDITEQKTSDNAMHAIVESSIRITGDAFFVKLIENVCEWLDCDAALIGILKQGTTIDTLAVQIDGKKIDGIRYPLKNTPSENVMKEGVCIYPENVTGLFPQDQDLQEFNAEGYIGVVLKDSRNSNIGILSAVSRKKLLVGEIEKEGFNIIAAIASAEIERMHTENDLLKSEERLNLALEAVSDAVWDWQVDTGDIYFSKRWYTMLGYDPNELTQSLNTWRNLIHPDDLPDAEKVFIQNLKSSEPFEIEFRMRAKDNKWRRILARGRTVEKDSKGRTVRMIGTHMDITERKKMDELIQQNQKMESIGSLAGGIAHDFNNLLFPIIGMAEMLLEDLPPESPEHAKIKEILKAGERGSALVDQILAFSRQSEHKKIPLRVQSVIKDVLNLSRSTIPTNIHIDEDIRTDCSLVMADPTQIHQIALNLITNAYHAVEKNGGQISVRLRESILEDPDLLNTNLKPGRHVILSVSDTGYGMPPELLSKIFDPYFTTKAKGKGTGLGLAVVHGIVQEHNGAIKVYSEMEKGSTFHVYFPVMADTETVESVEEEVEEIPTGSGHILLVDDEESVLILEKQMLERLNYQVTEQNSSVEALAAFKSNPDSYDLIMTDMTMPDMTGDRLAKEILSIRPEIPIIICTGFSERINQEIAEAAGIKGFLMKPVIKSEMAKMIHKVMDTAKSP